MTLSAGTRLGPYEILGPLGAGGMGEVYRARDQRLGREVAVKILPPTFSADPDRIRRFERETRLAGSLNHPNIVTVHDVGTHDGSSFLVTELLEGETLRGRLSGQPLQQLKALDYALQVAHGLAAAHEKGIVHRDLKPENLFVTREGRVKILDFGLAKLARDERHDLTSAVTGTVPGVVLGTVGYMSPEQVQGEPSDHRSDIFSFGAVLYEMLSGRRAFHGRSSVETMHGILKAEVPDLSQSDRAVAPALAMIVRHCLERDPRDRFQSASDLAFDLASVATLSSRPALATPRARPSPRPFALASLVVAFAAAAGGYVLGARASLAPPTPAMAVQRLTDLAGLEESPAISPDGKSVAFTAAVDGRQQLFVRLMAGGTPLQITKHAADHQFPRWSPDSSSLVYFSPPRGAEAQGTIWEIPALGGSPRRITTSGSGADLSHDGKRIAFFRFNEGRVELMVAGRDGLGARVVTRLDSSPPRAGWVYLYPRWSPDDRSIAYQAGVNFDYNVFVAPAAGGEPRAITREGNQLDGYTWLADGSGIVYSSAAGTTILYLPTFNLWEVPLGEGAPRQLTFGESSYVNPDLRAAGVLVASRRRMQFDVWKFPVGGSAAENVAAARRITRQTGQVQTPSVSPGDRELVYLADSGGHGNLWVMKLDTGELRQITFEQESNVGVGVPVWSPDGSVIAFVSTRDNPLWSVGIWLVKPDGSELRKVEADGGWASWSADGRWLYYNELSTLTLKKLPAAGGPAVTVRSDRAARTALTPNGKTLYYMVDLPMTTGRVDVEVRAATPEDGPSRVVARIVGSRMPGVAFQPVLSPDGEWLVHARTDGVTTNLWGISTKDGSERQLTDFGQRATLIARRVSWSSDGRSIYAALGEGDADVVLLAGLR